MIHSATQSSKFIKFVRKLRPHFQGLPIRAETIAVGILEKLWHTTIVNAQRGDIGKLDDDSIAEAIGWDGESAEIVSILVECGWLDVCETHRLVVHDWAEHAPRHVKQNIGKKGGFVVRDDKKGETDNAIVIRDDGKSPPSVIDDAGSEEISPTPNLTKPNVTKPNQTRESAHTLANSRSEQFNQTWSRWKSHRNENFQPLTPTSEEVALMELARCYPGDEGQQIAAIEFSILRGAKNLILNGDHRTRDTPRGKPDQGDKAARREELFSKIGKV